MSKKLLDKTLRSYILFSILVLAISSPFFYFFTDKLFIADADETLVNHQKEFLTNNLPSLKEKDIALWNKINRDIKIEKPVSPIQKDSLFYRFYYDTLEDENEPYRVLVAPVSIEDKPYMFLARINLIESEDLVVNIGVLFCVTLVVLLIGLYFITRHLSTKLWQPFYLTLQQMENFELDKRVLPDPVTTHVEEFERLNLSIHRLLERNLSAYKNQQEFIENAAHELQTPLAVFRAKLDILVQQMPFTHELGETLSDLNEAASRLTRVNKNLLLLSRIENSHYIREEVSVRASVLKQAEFLREQAGEKKLTVQLNPVEPLTILSNLALLEIAIGNLLLNALQHNMPGGQIQITLQGKKLTVANSGIPSPLATDKLFLRFSNSSDGGSGLGLAIVKKISELQGWTLSYNYHAERHIFQIEFIPNHDAVHSNP